MDPHNTTQLRGGIKRLLTVEGFGFITGDDGIDRFFHESVVQNRLFQDLAVGDRVLFTHAEAVKGPRAVDVTVLD